MARQRSFNPDRVAYFERDTRTPLFTNTVQLTGRGVIMALLIDSEGAVAIPIAFALTASLETVALASVLTLKLSRAARSDASLP